MPSLIIARPEPRSVSTWGCAQEKEAEEIPRGGGGEGNGAREDRGTAGIKGDSGSEKGKKAKAQTDVGYLANRGVGNQSQSLWLRADGIGAIVDCNGHRIRNHNVTCRAVRFEGRRYARNPAVILSRCRDHPRISYRDQLRRIACPCHLGGKILGCGGMYVSSYRRELERQCRGWAEKCYARRRDGDRLKLLRISATCDRQHRCTDCD